MSKTAKTKPTPRVEIDPAAYAAEKLARLRAQRQGLEIEQQEREREVIDLEARVEAGRPAADGSRLQRPHRDGDALKELGTARARLEIVNRDLREARRQIAHFDAVLKAGQAKAAAEAAVQKHREEIRQAEAEVEAHQKAIADYTRLAADKRTEADTATEREAEAMRKGQVLDAGALQALHAATVAERAAAQVRAALTETQQRIEALRHQVDDAKARAAGAEDLLRETEHEDALARYVPYLARFMEMRASLHGWASVALPDLDHEVRVYLREREEISENGETAED